MDPIRLSITRSGLLQVHHTPDLFQAMGRMVMHPTADVELHLDRIELADPLSVAYLIDAVLARKDMGRVSVHVDGRLGGPALALAFTADPGRLSIAPDTWFIMPSSLEARRDTSPAYLAVELLNVSREAANRTRYRPAAGGEILGAADLVAGGIADIIVS